MESEGSILSEHKNPFPGQVVRYVEFSGSWYGEYRPYTQSPEGASVVTSEVGDHKFRPTTGRHKPVLDIDLPVKVLPSSTEGHHHLFIDKEMSWEDYEKLLNVLVEVGIVEPGYRNASVARKHSAVRLPWIKKAVEDKHD